MNKNLLRIYLDDLIEPDPDYTDEPILPRKKTASGTFLGERGCPYVPEPAQPVFESGQASGVL